MENAIATRTTLGPALERSIFGDRGAQFVDRQNWDLCVTPDGLEMDEYDDAASRYLVVHEGGAHLGSCRVRPIAAGTMIQDHFAGIFPAAEGFLKSQAGRIWELTRFCRSPEMSTGESTLMLDQLAELMDEFRDSNDVTGFVAVVYPAVSRFLSRIGVRFLKIATSMLDGRRIEMICITHFVASKRLVAARAAQSDLRPALQIAA